MFDNIKFIKQNNVLVNEQIIQHSNIGNISLKDNEENFMNSFETDESTFDDNNKTKI